ncbi:hypothetical protein GCM10027293_10790 [Pontibacter aydingkolensis]
MYRQLLQDPRAVDSVTVQAGSHYKRGLLHKALWGSRHRDLWAEPVRVPVLDPDSVKGGLEVEKIGGGMQTINAALEAESGMTYSLRTVDKRSAKILPLPIRRTFVANVVRDQTSALHPYGALVVAPLAEAAGVPHATPRLVYVRPGEEHFNQYDEKLSDRLYMLEEKFNDERAITGDVAGAHDIVGQWEWAEYKEGGEHLYRPIPKDRDNAFYRFGNGVFSWLFSRKWAFRKFESFTADYKDVKALTVNSEFIDARAMPEVTGAQFDSLAHVLQQEVTDEVIERAVRQLPENIYALQGEELTNKLKSRRDKLDVAAWEFYEILSERVLVVGTDREDIFEVNRMPGGETDVTVRRKSDEKVMYHRIFYSGETKEIVLHGLAENDVFRVSGETDKGIKVKIVGGRGQDEVYDTSDVRGWGKKTWVYDTPRETKIESGPETKEKTSRKPEVNFFDREGYRR